MEHIYIPIFLGALVLTGVAKLLGSAGRSHILTIDYSGIADPEQLHRWAAKCLSFGAFAMVLLALAAFAAPFYAELFLALSLILVIGIAVAVILGARKFRRA